MISLLLQFFIAGGLLVLTVWLELKHLTEVFQFKRRNTRERVGRIVRLLVGGLCLECLVDPLIPGTASLSIDSPNATATLPENLRLRIAPLPIVGEASTSRAFETGLDARGHAAVSVSMGLFETSVRLELFDESMPTTPIRVADVYVSPIFRRQIAYKSIKL